MAQIDALRGVCYNNPGEVIFLELFEAVNILGDFLSVRDIPVLSRQALTEKYGFAQADVMVLFGGSVLCGGDILAQAIRNDVAKRYMIVGGAGHTTPALREKMRPFLPGVETCSMQEAELFDLYLQKAHNLKADHLETRSTNCGNNITNLLSLLDEQHIPCKSIILTQDGTMQKRMGAALHKFAPEIQCIHYAAYQAHLTRGMQYDAPIKGMWDVDRYITMLLGEVARLRDDEQGYGPRGKNFIAHVDIPGVVEKAFGQLQSLYAVRNANPLFAG